MPIRSITAQNFKGIEDETSFEIRPITIFVGPNSSGKSSCLHAIASLAQTIKLGNSIPALILDDEYAQVHLGRFIEIAHSKSYSQPIKLSLNLGNVEITISDKTTLKGECTASYSFKCKKTTEEIYLNEVNLNIGDYGIRIKRDKEVTDKETEYTVTYAKNLKAKAIRKSNFLFQLKSSSGEDIHRNEWFNLFFAIETIQNIVEQSLRHTMYLGPFRQSPLRRYPFRGATASEVGAQGEATITMLASEVVQPRDKPHFNEINGWLSELGLAKGVGVARVVSSDLFDVSLTLNDDKILPIADLGYGLSQVLPVLTQCSFAPNNSTLLFEQPELHLHEGAARKLAKVFIDTFKTKKANLVIETHSKELINELFANIRNGNIDLNDIAIYSVKRDGGKSIYNKLVIEKHDDGLEISDPWVNELIR